MRVPTKRSGRTLTFLVAGCALALIGAGLTLFYSPSHSYGTHYAPTARAANLPIFHPPQPQSTEVFTTAHPTVLDAMEDFFDYQPTPVQPIAFTHKVHLAKGLKCQFCHTGVNTGPDAVIPSVKFCMECHSVIDTGNPEIKKIAAYQSRGEDIPWQRVYAFRQSAHVRFNHAPHIRAGVACSTCHGDMTKQTTAVRAVDLNMGYCLDCHVQKKVSVDCITCHF